MSLVVSLASLQHLQLAVPAPTTTLSMRNIQQAVFVPTTRTDIVWIRFQASFTFSSFHFVYLLRPATAPSTPRPPRATARVRPLWWVCFHRALSVSPALHSEAMDLEVVSALSPRRLVFFDVPLRRGPEADLRRDTLVVGCNSL